MSTYEEARREYIAAMGEELGIIFHLLWNHVAHLYSEWDVYLDLFGKDQERFDVMNASAPGFFKTVQDSLWKSVLLQLCRLTDAPGKPGERRLSIRTMLKSESAHEVVDLPILVHNAIERTAFARDWRNRHIAHLDLDHALDKGSKPLEAASRVSVRDALEALVKVLNAVSLHFASQTSLFDIESGSSSGSSSVISDLRLMNRLRHERQERLMSGDATPDDMDWKKWHD